MKTHFGEEAQSIKASKLFRVNLKQCEGAGTAMLVDLGAIAFLGFASERMIGRGNECVKDNDWYSQCKPKVGLFPEMRTDLDEKLALSSRVLP